jgi:hypothetical protein
MSDLTDIFMAAAHEGQRRYANWNDTLFDELCLGPATNLANSLEGAAGTEDVVTAYLSLVREAIACEYVTGANDTFFERCLVDLVPDQLALIAPDRRLPALARVWNLCEGLAGEPAWLDQYVRARADDIHNIARLDEFLIEALTPALSPAAPADWRAPYRVITLDTRSIDDDFVPGDMRLCAPRVVHITDTRRDVHLAVLLSRDGGSRLFGPVRKLSEHVESGTAPDIVLGDSAVRIGQHSVDLPWLGVSRRYVLAQSGFFVASAVNSQRLWILESTS